MKLSPKSNTGMTLLEILIAMSLMVVLLGFVWGMVTLFSKDYLSGEKRVNRAQLVRSVSQMLSDDLGAAVQDPIHPTQKGSSETVNIRRFGLRGDETTLQIDVVEPNLLVESASLAENRAAAATSSKPAHPQAPELKTVFYEFVRPNALQHSNSDTAKKKAGSLKAESVGFVRKYGLSRKELSYEAPDPELEKNNFEQSKQIGSLNGFNNGSGDNRTILDTLHTDTPLEEPFLTAPQIAMEIDDGTLWMPEVVDCRFRYFDGRQWRSSWNSIKQNGLPTAIEVDLKLLPLDDVETLRSSPILPRIVYSANRFSSVSQKNPRAENSGPLTLETASELLELSPVITRSIITRVPITPLSSHKTFKRRKPLPAAAGAVGAETGSGSASIGAAHGDLIGGRAFSGTSGPFPAAGSGQGESAFGNLTVPGQANPVTPFDSVDSLITGFEPSSGSGFDGMVSSSSGTVIPTETTAPASPKTESQGGWIRGNR